MPTALPLMIFSIGAILLRYLIPRTLSAESNAIIGLLFRRLIKLPKMPYRADTMIDMPRDI